MTTTKSSTELPTKTAEILDEGNWTAVYMPPPRAREIIEAKGWRTATARDRRGRQYRYYIRPGGEPRSKGGQVDTDYVWELDEALMLALEAHVIDCTLHPAGKGQDCELCGGTDRTTTDDLEAYGQEADRAYHGGP